MNTCSRPILLTRPQPQLERSAQFLEAAGYSVMRVPLLRISPPTRPPSAALLHWASAAQWMIFTSQHAVDAALNIWPHTPGPRIAAIGEATANKLRAAHWPVHWQAPGGSGESLLDDSQAPQWQGKIAIMAGRGGRRQLKRQLLARGCQVEKILLYQRQAESVSAATLTDIARSSPIAVFSSGFGLRRWQELMQKHQLESGLLLDTLVASTRLCKLASQLGYAGHLQALPSMSDQAILTALKEWKHD